ncbi:hypothetical protein COU74_03335 [Candidatus Peregrinibacteria bacterium CG10_big_fil_rev_8_21_14_0_10_36_19]|nr:MAG: hypothetical protein COU74_03335 [Candidatus Peregrinibacteria bacterium CG10_big_fil_rev_8_21_14_0_10_36_19]
MTDLDIISSGSVKLNKLSYEVEVDGIKVPMRYREFSLLKFFMEHPGEVLTRTRLLEEVWDRNIFCATNTIDVHVSLLRRKLRSQSFRNHIKTVHCVGYIFNS